MRQRFYLTLRTQTQYEAVFVFHPFNHILLLGVVDQPVSIRREGWLLLRTRHAGYEEFGCGAGVYVFAAAPRGLQTEARLDSGADRR